MKREKKKLLLRNMKKKSTPQEQFEKKVLHYKIRDFF